MMMATKRRVGSIGATCALVAFGWAGNARANEVWVAPTYQQDIGGLGVASNVIWPVTPIGVVRLAWSIPDDLDAFQGAKVAIIPNSPGGAATLNLFVCSGQNGSAISPGACASATPIGFAGVANQLVEVDISAALTGRVGAAGTSYLAILAYPAPTTATDRIVGLRFKYAPKAPAGVATLAARVTFRTAASSSPARTSTSRATAGSAVTSPSSGP